MTCHQTMKVMTRWTLSDGRIDENSIGETTNHQTVQANVPLVMEGNAPCLADGITTAPTSAHVVLSMPDPANPNEFYYSQVIAENTSTEVSINC